MVVGDHQGLVERLQGTMLHEHWRIEFRARRRRRAELRLMHKRFKGPWPSAEDEAGHEAGR